MSISNHHIVVKAPAPDAEDQDQSNVREVGKLLPSRYYLTHFREFLDVIKQRYTHVLRQQHLEFLRDFDALDTDSQCLYVRLVNRQATLFDSRKLRYPEIRRLEEKLATLQYNRFVRQPDYHDGSRWLEALTRADLLKQISSQCASGSFRRTWQKKDLLEFAVQHLDFRHSVVLQSMQTYVIQRRTSEISYLLFLYFGKPEQGLGRFTLRDLGVMRSGAFKKTFEARFETIEDAESSWFYCQRLRDVKNLGKKEALGWSKQLSDWPNPTGEDSAVMRDQLVYRLGEKIEKYGCQQAAESVYSYSDVWPATERKIRLAYQRGDKVSVESALVSAIDDPSCDDELHFARDFYQRKFCKKKTSRITDILRQSAVLPIDESYRDSPEHGAAAYFRAKGARVFFSENRLWKGLFGLIFWPLLFENEEAALYNDFEKRPGDLDNGAFYRRFSTEIESVLQEFLSESSRRNMLLDRSTRWYGKPNGVFNWRPELLDELFAFLNVASASGVIAVLRRMAKDYANNHSGFPDLLVLENNTARFVEIKAEGDQLRRNQLKQIIALEEAGLNVEVNRVEWIFDPDQIYVVVDIETTGSRSSSGKITEIAAVKMRGNEIIDQWETLVNPERSIPSMITGLTGITNQMVANAPRFSEIADTFEAFTSGAVFVAHNVKFDYGFIRTEFRRLDRNYRRPTLCTCVEMRKWYKGYASYSLASLCENFEIDLVSHHRAMCDALAASELLKLVNLKRLSDRKVYR